MRGCPGCGCVVADIDLHLSVCPHLITQEQRDRLQWGPPEDWPRKPGAPATPPIDALEA